MLESVLAVDISPWAVRIVSVVFGALIGSFCNVAIHRWPRGMSVVAPPSHCPRCKAAIPAYRNVPIVGYLWLQGRASCCGAPISKRYFFVELLTAALALAVAERYVVRAAADTTLTVAAVEAALYFTFLAGLVVVTFVDLEWLEIPDEVSLPVAALGLLTSPFRPFPGAVDAAIGAGAGFLIVQLVFVWSYERLLGRRGMGEGDSKLLLMIGAFLGWKAVLFSLVAGSVQGLIAAAVSLATGKSLVPDPPYHEAVDAEHVDPSISDSTPSASGAPSSASEASTSTNADVAEGVGQLKIPFGPFLALGAAEFFFFGPSLMGAYHAIMGG